MSDRPVVSWQVLGEVSFRVGEAEGHVTGVQQRSVLAFLITRAGEVVTSDEIVLELWPETPPKTARNSIQRFIADIRRALGEHAERIETTTDGYLLRTTGHEVDAVRAEQLIVEARAARGIDPARTSRLLTEALALWRGRPFAGAGELPALVVAGRRLDALRLDAIEERFAADLDRGDHVAVATSIGEIALAHPYRERFWELWAMALYRSGRLREALAVLDDHRRQLVDDLGVDPSPRFQQLAGRMLDHDPELGEPRSAPNVEPVAPTSPSVPVPMPIPLPPHVARFTTTDFVGRADERKRFGELADVALSGSPRLVIVSGEAGIGKTHFAAHMTRSLFDEGVPVLYGRADSALADPYGPWIEALGHAVRHLEDDRITSLRAALSTLLPGPDDAGVDVSNTSGDGDTSTQRIMMFQSVVALIDAVAAATPVAIVLDDLQWADDSSMELVRYVTERVTGPVLFVGAFRSDQVDTDSAVDRIIGELSGASWTTSIELGPLPPPEIGQLAMTLLAKIDGAPMVESPGATVADAPPTSELATRIARLSEGHPFFASELVRHGIEQLDSALPSSVRRVVRQRCQRFGEAALGLLQSASVIGREFDLEMLVAVSGVDESIVLATLERALVASLVVDAPGRGDRFGFAHDLVRRALMDDLSTARRSRLHLATAEALLSRGDDRRAIDFGELATHLVAADDPRAAERAFDAARRAGRAAARGYAPAEAVGWFEAALAQLRHLDDSWAGERASLMVELGVQQRGTGDDKFRTTLLRAGELAADVGDVESIVAAAIANTRGTYSTFLEVDHAVIAQLEAALDVVGPERTIERTNLLANLFSEQWDEAHEERIAAVRHEALAAARELGDVDTHLNVLVRLLRSRTAGMTDADRRSIIDEIRLLSSTASSTAPSVSISVLLFEQQEALLAADPDGWARATEAVRQMAIDVPLADIEQSATLTEVVEACVLGDVTEFDRLAHAAVELGVERGDRDAWQNFEAQLMSLRVMQGRADELLDLVLGLVAQWPDVAVYPSVAAALHAEAGEREIAGDLVDRQAAVGFDATGDLLNVQTLSLWGMAAVAAGRTKVAAQLIELLEPHHGQIIGTLNQVVEPVATVLARLHTSIGSFERAVEHLDTAADIARRFDARWMAARVDLAEAELLIARDIDGDLSRANKVLDRVEQVADEHGYAGFTRATRAAIEGMR